MEWSRCAPALPDNRIATSPGFLATWPFISVTALLSHAFREIDCRQITIADQPLDRMRAKLRAIKEGDVAGLHCVFFAVSACSLTSPCAMLPSRRAMFCSRRSVERRRK